MSNDRQCGATALGRICQMPVPFEILFAHRVVRDGQTSLIPASQFLQQNATETSRRNLCRQVAPGKRLEFEVFSLLCTLCMTHFEFKAVDETPKSMLARARLTYKITDFAVSPLSRCACGMDG